MLVLLSHQNWSKAKRTLVSSVGPNILLPGVIKSRPLSNHMADIIKQWPDVTC